MRTSVAATTAGVAGALLGGFAVGVSVLLWLGEERSPRSLALSLPATETTLDSNVVSQPVNLEAQEINLDSSLHVQSVLDSTKLPSDFEQSASMYLLLSRAGEADLERYINESFSIASRNQRVAALSIIFGRYAVVNPNKALDRALALNQLTLQEKSNLIRSIFNEWTVIDREAASAAIEALPQVFGFTAASAIMWRSDDLSADQRAQLAQEIGPSDDWVAATVASIRSEASKVDPRTTFYERIRNTTNIQELNSDLLNIVRHWFELEGPVILSEIHESIEHAGTRRFVLSNLIWNAIGSKAATPAAVLDAVSNFANDSDTQWASDVVFRIWANMDPVQAFEASIEYGNRLGGDDIRSSVVQTWANKDARGLLAKASTLPSQYRETAVIKAIGRIAIDAPEEAIQYADNLATHTSRMSARDEIVNRWSSADAEAAFEWLMYDEFDESDRTNLSIYFNTFSKFLKQDFEAAQTFASNYQGTLRNRLVERVARHLINSDLDRAIDYVQNVKGKYQRWLQHEIGTELALRDPDEALRYGDSISKEHRDEYFKSMINGWANQDLVSLYDNLQLVPRKFQSYAAEEILKFNGRKKHLSDQQVRKLESMREPEELIATSSE